MKIKHYPGKAVMNDPSWLEIDIPNHALGLQYEANWLDAQRSLSSGNSSSNSWDSYSGNGFTDTISSKLGHYQNMLRGISETETTIHKSNDKISIGGSVRLKYHSEKCLSRINSKNRKDMQDDTYSFYSDECYSQIQGRNNKTSPSPKNFNGENIYGTVYRISNTFNDRLSIKSSVINEKPTTPSEYDENDSDISAFRPISNTYQLREKVEIHKNNNNNGSLPKPKPRTKLPKTIVNQIPQKESDLEKQLIKKSVRFDNKKTEIDVQESLDDIIYETRSNLEYFDSEGSLNDTRGEEWEETDTNNTQSALHNNAFHYNSDLFSPKELSERLKSLTVSELDLYAFPQKIEKSNNQPEHKKSKQNKKRADSENVIRNSSSESNERLSSVMPESGLYAYPQKPRKNDAKANSVKSNKEGRKAKSKSKKHDFRNSSVSEDETQDRVHEWIDDQNKYVTVINTNQSIINAKSVRNSNNNSNVNAKKCVNVLQLSSETDTDHSGEEYGDEPGSRIQSKKYSDGFDANQQVKDLQLTSSRDYGEVSLDRNDSGYYEAPKKVRQRIPPRNICCSSTESDSGSEKNHRKSESDSGESLESTNKKYKENIYDLYKNEHKNSRINVKCEKAPSVQNGSLQNKNRKKNHSIKSESENNMCSEPNSDFLIPRPKLIVPVHTYAIRKRRTGNLLNRKSFSKCTDVENNVHNESTNELNNKDILQKKKIYIEYKLTCLNPVSFLISNLI
ncbi:hypothetical protein ILUMI_03973 [Ignelater luminosus]|uniref:Uncharacterized protein n=1 Tax=Ignelater luminosus TaxID=2038154 RepID=A0A8K0D9Z9_IGNLU|nr:hypothetical protein ILUMI_03973 [Ignelater luminosus]